MTKVGEFTVTGNAYHDIVDILSSNDYAVEVFTPPMQSEENTYNRKHVIKVLELGVLEREGE